MLTRTSVPLWTWIVIIAVGSVIVLVLLILLIRCSARLKSLEMQSLPDPAIIPTRRVTVRRGRMVPMSRYFSLTGSKFGLDNFMTLEDGKAVDHGSIRSRSPFGLWLSSLQDRSHSRLSEISGRGHASQVPGSYLTTPEPAFMSQHRHKASTGSAYSLPSIINGRELAEDARVDKVRTESPTAADRSTRHTNFSRAFSPFPWSAVANMSVPSKLSQVIGSSTQGSAITTQPTQPSDANVGASQAFHTTQRRILQQPRNSPRSSNTLSLAQAVGVVRQSSHSRSSSVGGESRDH